MLSNQSKKNAMSGSWQNKILLVKLLSNSGLSFSALLYIVDYMYICTEKCFRCFV